MRIKTVGFGFALAFALLATAAAGELRFDHNAIVDFSATSGEPFIRVGPDDAVYVSVPFGFSTTVSLLWRSIDGGRSFIPLGTPIVRDAVLAPGGGDTHLDFDHAGRLYYADLSAACVTAAVSEDGGNTFPPDRVNPLACIGEDDPGAVQDDRQWVAAFGDGIGYVTMRNLLVSVGPNFHLFKTTDGGLGWDGGRTIGTVAQSGPLMLDKTKRRVTVDSIERDAILLYQIFYSSNTSLRLFRIADLDDGSDLVVDNLPVVTPGGTVNSVFPVLSIDRAGNLYVVWSSGASSIRMVTSSDRGQTWSAPVQVNPPALAGTNIMPWIAAGDAGRVDVVWYRSPLAGNPIDPASRWDIWLAQSLDALSPAPTWEVARVNENTIHTGEICLIGLNCDTALPPGSRDRSFLEFPSVAIDSRGAAFVTYNDNTNQSAGGGESGAPYVMVARQSGGASLYADVGAIDPGPGNVEIASPAAGESVALPVTARGTHTLPPDTFDRDEADDGRFPDHGPVVGESVPALELLGVVLEDDAERLTVTMELADLTPVALAAAAPSSAGDGVLYLAQWDFDDVVYWVAAEVRAGQPVFLTGTLGIIRSSTSKKYITYNPDLQLSLEVTGEIVGTAPGAVRLSIPRALVGQPEDGDELQTVTAYALSERGPLVPVGMENVPSPTSLPLQVDATGPVTYVLGGGARLAGSVEVAADDPGFINPTPAAVALDGTWEAPFAEGSLAPGAHTLYARQRITGLGPSPAASVAFTVAGAPTVLCLEEDDPSIAYSNGWHSVADAEASGGGFRYRNGSSPQGGLALELEVPAGATGALDYDYATSTQGGGADLYLDGALRQRIAYAGAIGSNRSPEFGVGFRIADLAPGTHTLELRNATGGVFVDRFCLESTASTSQPAAAPGPTASDDRSLGAGAKALVPLALPPGTTALSIVAQSTPALPIQLALVDLTGRALASAKSSGGVAVLELPAGAGTYALQATNLGLGEAQVWTLVTPLVATGAAP
ncbi:MAG TPA: hypothetical protein VI942_09075 [Thermoanaerobaculia bacterium]|nr:hypothetical protein [Thermoanaerobaculia bacterium]